MPCLPALHLLAFAAPALPFTISFSPPFHGAPCTEFSGWESFTVPSNGANAPDDPATTSNGAALIQLVPGAIITAAGNIDHLSLPPAYQITDSVPADLEEVVLQVSIHLNQMPWSSAVLMYTDGGGNPQSISPTTSSFLVQQMGHEERLLTWDLAANPDTILAYEIRFTAANSFTTLDALKLDTRYRCGPATSFCHPGTSGILACPCSNPPAAPAQGCDNSPATGGAILAATGFASLSADSVQFTSSGEGANASSIFLQGSVALSPGLAFGQGVRCAGGQLVRLYVKTASGGVAVAPVGADLQVSARSAALGDSLSPGAIRYYQTYYRDPIVLGGCPASSTFNVSQALSIVWSP